MGKQFVQLRAGALRTTSRVLIDALAPGPLQGIELEVGILVPRAHPRIANLHLKFRLLDGFDD
ncbi:hypothetical protein D9M68_791830 [compost metagenome]